MTQYQKALKIAKKLDSKDHHLLSEIYRSIGSLVLDEGNPIETLSIFRRAEKA